IASACWNARRASPRRPMRSYRFLRNRRTRRRGTRRAGVNTLGSLSTRFQAGPTLLTPQRAPATLEGDGRRTRRSSSPATGSEGEETMMMHTFVGRYAVGLSLAASALAPPAQQPWLAVFDKVGLTPQQIAAIDEGRPVAKTLSWGGPSEVYVFGAVHVNGSATDYLRRMRDIGGGARALGVPASRPRPPRAARR